MKFVVLLVISESIAYALCCCPPPPQTLFDETFLYEYTWNNIHAYIAYNGPNMRLWGFKWWWAKFCNTFIWNHDYFGHLLWDSNNFSFKFLQFLHFGWRTKMCQWFWVNEWKYCIWWTICDWSKHVLMEEIFFAILIY